MSKGKRLVVLVALVLVVLTGSFRQTLVPAGAVSPQPTPTPWLRVIEETGLEETDYKHILFETTIDKISNSEDGSVRTCLRLPSQMSNSDKQFLWERINGFTIGENPLYLVLKFDIMPSVLGFFDLDKPVEFSGAFSSKGSAFLTLRQGIVSIEAWIK